MAADYNSSITKKCKKERGSHLFESFVKTVLGFI